MNVLKVGGNVTAIFEDGKILSLSDCSNELFMDLINNDYTYEEVVKKIMPDYIDVISIKKFIEEKSQWLKMKGNSVIMPSVSELSIPDDFVEKLVESEKKGDENLITTYKNFWTLVSLNPDSRVRNNICWFIRKWDMKISKSGLIIAYRNADVKNEGEDFDLALTKTIVKERESIKHVMKKSPKDFVVIKFDNTEYGGDVSYTVEKIPYSNYGCQDGVVLGTVEELYQKLVNDEAVSATTFTDHHSHTFNINIGKIVSMPREHTDSCQDHTCSTGLHVASKGWLKRNYFGNVGLKVLVNPAFVVAVPPEDSYGKMRTCEYLPIGTISFDENGDVVDDISVEGFEDDYFNTICYEGQVNNEDLDNYTLPVPGDMIEIDRDAMWEKLRQIAKSLKNEQKG